MSNSLLIIGFFTYDNNVENIYLNDFLERIECFTTSTKRDRIFEIDFWQSKNQITIHYFKVYKTEDKGIGTQALIFLKNGQLLKVLMY